MTPELIELSKQAAEVLGVPACKKWAIGYEPDYGPIYDETKTVWLVEDSGRCADIANDRMLATTHSQDTIHVWYEGFYKKGDIFAYEDEVCWYEGFYKKGGIFDYEVEVYLADHNGDRSQAWRVAVLKAVIEQEKGK